MRIAIDTGGTFTDCVYLKNGELRVLKALSTPDDPARSVLNAIRQIVNDNAEQARGRGEQSSAENLEICHGTTIGTNALLERKGARVAFVTTAGFEDTIAIGRQARQHLYDWMATPQPCLVPGELRLGVNERVTADGEILGSPSEEELTELCEKIHASEAESVAVSLLFSFVNPQNEKRIADVLRRTKPRQGPGPLPASISHEILPEFREYERAATVVVNAYLAPKAGDYVQRLETAIGGQNGSLYVMQSSGGIISANIASREPVRTVLSGPAGGVVGAHKVAQLAGFKNIIGFDMGGTSTDVSLIDAFGPKTTNESRISDIPISVPMLDIHTVGAGGGSLAWLDRGGILHVGPMSAGADPGPISYGRGEQPTVTDANLILGRLDPEFTLGGTVRLDETRTRNYMEQSRGQISTVEKFAAGIVRLAEAEMEKAIRVISVERGHDPRDFTLVAFGGAGPLHACSLARALSIPHVLVPAMPGALSALGILWSDVVRDYSRTVMLRIDHDNLASLESHFAELETKAATEFRDEALQGVSIRSADLRYAGQGYEINVPAGPKMLDGFHAAHRKRYGHADPTRGIEAVSLRVRMIASAEPIAIPRRPRSAEDCTSALLKRKRVVFDGESKDSVTLDTPVYDRARLLPGNKLTGPAIVHEYSATTVITPGCSAEVDEFSNIVIEV